jgi:hypothetical protein
MDEVTIEVNNVPIPLTTAIAMAKVKENDWRVVVCPILTELYDLKDHGHPELGTVITEIRTIHNKVRRDQPTTSNNIPFGQDQALQLSNTIGNIPESLKTEEAIALMKKAVEAGWLDERWQPNLSLSQAALLAFELADRLKLRAKWKVFGQLWSRNSESLRTKYNEAMNQRQSLKLQDKMKKALR